MRNIRAIAARELKSYFATPVAYVFIVIFLAFTGALAFYVGGFFESGQANLISFFFYHTWLYLLLIPAISMRLWAEERKTGTIELLMTLPVSSSEAVLGKYFAAWGFAGIALALTFPMWITVNILGNPDNGVILASYAGSFVMAGAFLAIGSCVSALTKNQVVAFVLAAVLCFVFLMSGVEIVQAFFRAWAPPKFVDAIAELSFLTNFGDLSQGVIDIRDILFFASVIAVALFINTAIVEIKKSA